MKSIMSWNLRKLSCIEKIIQAPRRLLHLSLLSISHQVLAGDSETLSELNPFNLMLFSIAIGAGMLSTLIGRKHNKKSPLPPHDS